jgi:NTP pyrophosphatase (non-canonical NTP hydrolase)
MRQVDDFIEYINRNYPEPYSVPRRIRTYGMADRLEAAMGLMGEAGEVGELFKKECFYGKPHDTGKLTEELGDVFHYFCRVLHLNNISINAVVQSHKEKMSKRFPEGYTDAAAIARADEEKV